MIDWLAVYDATTQRCFYIPAMVLGSGQNSLYLRLCPTRNGQVSGTHPASRYVEI